MTDEWISTEHWHNDVDRWKPKHSGENPIPVPLCLPKNLTRTGMGLKLGLRCDVYCSFWIPYICGATVPHILLQLPISIHLWPSLDVCVLTDVSFLTSYPYSDSCHNLITNCPTSRISFPPRYPCNPPSLFVYILPHNAATERLWVVVHDITTVFWRGQISGFSCAYAALYCYHQGCSMTHANEIQNLMSVWPCIIDTVI